MTDITELDDIASRALASMFLTATADVIHDGGETSADTLTKLIDDTGLVPDVCAAVLMASSWLAGAGNLTGEAVYAAALALEPDDEPAGGDGRDDDG